MFSTLTPPQTWRKNLCANEILMKYGELKKSKIFVFFFKSFKLLFLNANSYNCFENVAFLISIKNIFVYF